MQYRLIVIISLLLTHFFLPQPKLYAQQTYIEWQSIIGETTLDEQFEDVIQLPDSTYIAVGYQSVSNNVFLYHAYITHLEKNGKTILWAKTFGGDSTDKAYACTLAPDGNVLVAATTLSNNSGNVGKNNGAEDFWIFKINPQNGDLLWQNTLGGNNEDAPKEIMVLPDETVLVVGSTTSNTGYIKNKGQRDAWIVALNHQNGDTLWQKTIGGSNNDAINAITFNAETKTIWAAGFSSSTDGDATFTHGGKDFWLLKLSPEGKVLWQKSFGGSAPDVANAICIEPITHNIVVLGDALSGDGDLTQSFGQDDIWIFKADTLGNIIWQKTIGNASFNQSRTVLTLPNPNNNPNPDFLVTGITFDADLLPPNFTYDVWTLKVSGSSGTVIWEKRWGGTQYDFGNKAILNKNNEVVICGYTDSTDGDLDTAGLHTPTPVYRHGSHQAWIFAVNNATPLYYNNIDNNYNANFCIFPNIISQHNPTVNVQIKTPQNQFLPSTFYLKINTINGNSYVLPQTFFAQNNTPTPITLPNLPTGTYLVQLISPIENKVLGYTKIIIY